MRYICHLPYVLGRAGLIVTSLLFALGVASTTMMGMHRDHFVSSPAQLAGAGMVCIVLIVIAFRLRGQNDALMNGINGWIPNPWGSRRAGAGGWIGRIAYAE
ncbi:MAG: hypothetical protein WA826_12140 [Silvibacterium sp.]